MVVFYGLNMEGRREERSPIAIGDEDIADLVWIGWFISGRENGFDNHLREVGIEGADDLAFWKDVIFCEFADEVDLELSAEVVDAGG